MSKLLEQQKQAHRDNAIARALAGHKSAPKWAKDIVAVTRKSA